MQQPSSVGRELLWLLLFLAIFVVMEWFVVKYAVGPNLLHNDRIAIMLCAIVSGVIWIAIRAKYTRRT